MLPTLPQPPPPQPTGPEDHPPWWPQTRQETIVQLGVSALWISLLALCSLSFSDGPLIHPLAPLLPHGVSLPRRRPEQPSSSSRRRRLIQDAKDSTGLGFGLPDWEKETQEFFLPNPDLFETVDSKLADKDLSQDIPEAYFPYNLSGSYRGGGWLNYTRVNGTWDNITYYLPEGSAHVAAVIRIRTFIVEEDDRYHQAQLRVMLTPSPVEASTDDMAQHNTKAALSIQAEGLYDTLTGELQAMTNAPKFPPELPLFKELNLSYPDRVWPIGNKGTFKPSPCQFLVDLMPDTITEEAHTTELSGITDSNTDRRTGAYSAIMDREYIDVHIHVNILSLNETCTDYTSSNLEADLLRYDLFILKATKYALVATCLSFMQLLLLFRQMQYSTPASAAQKLSLTSIAMHSVFDAYLCLIHLTTGLYIDDLFNSFVMVSFLQFMVFSMFDLRLVLLVWRARHPLDFSTGWERMRSTLTKIYSAFYGGVFLCLIFYYYVRHHMNNFVFLLFSFWVPQIIRNVRTGEKYAIQERFLYGVTGIRLFFPLYAFGCPQNFLEFPTNFIVVVLLLFYAGFQVLMLDRQDKWGSRFFIPKRFQPDYYEYHRTFQADPDDEESCAICMTEFVTPDPDGKKSDVTVDLKKKVLTTPCNHHFCRDCLTRWMETKMICPTCRTPLPPYPGGL